MHKPKPWDTAALDAHEEAAREDAERARSGEDWQRATIYIERAFSNRTGSFQACRLPACRRARSCCGNPTVCVPAETVKSARMQNAIEDIYVKIQHNRRAASDVGGKPDIIDLVTRKPPRRK
jgi:hypothetical protein